MPGPRRIVQDPRTRGGAPVLEGSRVAVGDLVLEAARGRTVADLCRLFPTLTSDDIVAALEYGARALGSRAEAQPKLSVVVVVYGMPDQAERTLHSLSPQQQRGVSPEEYEVIVVENDSPRRLGEDRARRYSHRVRYHLREERTRSPVAAANFGALEARAAALALCIDGARLVTPGVVRACLDALRLDPRAVVGVPGYHLGSELQQQAAEHGYDERVEASLLESIGWPADGYRLFEVACLSGSCKGGTLRPIAESNFLAMPTRVFGELGGYDPRFTDHGGGYCNLDLYRRATELEAVRLFVLPGEGTFHQFHGGATTGGVVGRARTVLMDELRAEYERIRARPWALPDRVGELFGALCDGARPFLTPSAGAPPLRTHVQGSGPPAE